MGRLQQRFKLEKVAPVLRTVLQLLPAHRGVCSRTQQTAENRERRSLNWQDTVPGASMFGKASWRACARGWDASGLPVLEDARS